MKCILCNSQKSEVIFLTEYQQIVCCKNCELIYRNYHSEKELLDSSYNFKQQSRVNLAKTKLYLGFIKKLLGKLNSYSPRPLDIGCSDGYFLMLSNMYGFDVYGVEISKSAVSVAKERLGNTALIFDKPLKEINFKENFLML